MARNREFSQLQGTLADAESKIRLLVEQRETDAVGREVGRVAARLDDAQAEINRLHGLLKAERKRTADRDAEIAAAEARFSELDRYNEGLGDSFEQAKAYVDDLVLMVNGAKQAEVNAHAQVERLEEELRGQRMRAQRHQEEAAAARSALKRVELHEADTTARTLGQIEAARALAHQSVVEAHEQMGDVAAFAAELQAANEGLREELQSERAHSGMLQEQLHDMSQRLEDVRSQITRLPRQTPRIGMDSEAQRSRRQGSSV